MSSHDATFLSFLLRAIREKDEDGDLCVVEARLDRLPLLLLQLVCDHLGITDHATLTGLSRGFWSERYGNHPDIWEALLARGNPSRGFRAQNRASSAFFLHERRHCLAAKEGSASLLYDEAERPHPRIAHRR